MLLLSVFDFKWTAEALANIVDNAIKYTEHGTIRISAVSYEMFARIDISDTGTGISESEQAKIFARFYRSNSVQKQEGVGIGLYLARQIISGEGGYIKAVSYTHLIVDTFSNSRHALYYSSSYKFCMKCPVRILESSVTVKQWLRTRISK